MITIAAAQTRADYKTIAGLAKTVWTRHYTPIIGERQVAYMLKKFQSASAIEDQVEKGIFYYLLLFKGSPVGYFSFSKKGDFLFLSKLYVLNTARGKGVGKAALSFLESHARELGLKKIKLTVNKDNTHSIRAYEKMGFINLEGIVQDIGHGYVMDDYVMEKVLQ